MIALGGLDSTPYAAKPEAEKAYALQEARRHKDDYPHLRSCKAVTQYHVHATDGDVGHVKSLIVDAQTWAIRHVVVDTSNWWLGHEVVISSQLIENVSWSDGTIAVALTRQGVKDAPPYDPSNPLK